MTVNPEASQINKEYEYGWSNPEKYAIKAPKGLSREVVEMISKAKDEPQWMLDFRLKALDIFLSKPMPEWGADLSGLDLDEIYYYIKPEGMNARSWDDVPEDVKKTFERLGIPEAERAALAERLRTLTEAGGCAVLAHAPGADLSDVLPDAHLALHLQGELSHA